VNIWNARKEECFEIGRELVRIISNLENVPRIAPIIEELSQLIEGRPIS
jgi:hypothetical protein